MVFRIFLSRQAEKFLNESEEALNNRLRLKISLLVEPFEIDFVKIKGEDDTFRTRLGDYRILYQVFRNEEMVVVTRIDKRGRVYKR